MADLLHLIEIEAPPERVYDALATRAGLRGWWTDDVVAAAPAGSIAPGSIAEFGFYGRSTVFRMRVDELVSAERVRWTCVGDVAEWKGTHLVFDLRRTEEGTELHFLHGGWRSVDDELASTNTTWGELMYRLKDWAEGEEPGPHFAG